VCLAAATLIALGIAVGEILDVRWLRAGPRAWGVRPVPLPSLAGSLIAIAGIWLALFSGGRYLGRGRLLLTLVFIAGISWLVLTSWGIADPEGLQVPASSSAFGLSAVALAGLLVSFPRGAAAGQMVALTSGTVVTVPLLGYIIGARALTGFPFGFGAIAVPTIVILLLLSAAIAVARPDSGVMDVAIARSPGGVILRWLLMPVLALPPVLIVAISAGETRPLRTLAWVGSALSAVGVIALVAMSRVIDRVDEERLRAAQERIALAVGLSQDAELVAHVVESLGVVETVPDSLSVGVRRAAAEGVVGGDAFALVGIGGGRLALVLVDIESKGAQPALAAVRVRDALTSALHLGMGPSRALDSITWLVQNSGTMATAFVGVVDPDAAQLVYASAGHVPGLRMDAEGLSQLEHTGPLLHRDVEPGWTDVSCPIGPGTTLLVYSDGIADVMVRPEGGTSVEAFIDLVEACPHGRKPERLASWCLERLEESPDWVLIDDATLIAVTVERRRGWRRAGRAATGSGATGPTGVVGG
jgi:hypothetical protein